MQDWIAADHTDQLDDAPERRMSSAYDIITAVPGGPRYEQRLEAAVQAELNRLNHIRAAATRVWTVWKDGGRFAENSPAMGDLETALSAETPN